MVVTNTSLPNLSNVQRIQLSPHHMIPGRRLRRSIMPVLCVVMLFILMVRDRPIANPPERQIKRNSEIMFGLAEKSYPDGMGDTTLNVPATHKLVTTLRGSFFLGGNGQKILSSKIKTSLLFTYYPDAIDSVRSMFPNVPGGANTPAQIFVISPAIAYYKGEIWTLLRVWLNYERLKNSNEKVYNHWQDNFLYLQKFNNEMNPTSYGSLMGIPVPKQYARNSGTGDPRIFEFKGDLYAFYYMPMNINGNEWGNMYMWNLNKNFVLKPKIPGFEMNKIDSNWAPFVKDDKLHFLYSYDPVRILECTDRAICHFIGGAANITDAPFDWKHNCLRGGTPFQVYEYPYYIAIAHTRVLTKKGESFYGVHLTVLNVDTLQILYVSAPIKIHGSILRSATIVRNKYIKVPFFYPLSFIIENKNSLAVGAHINDHRAIILRLNGVAPIMNTVMYLDKKYKPSKPITTDLLHKYTTVSMELPNEVRYPYKGIKL